MKKAVTLIELLIAVFLLTAIILGVISFDVASRKFLRSSERKVEVINNLTLVLEHIDKNVLMAIGDKNRPAIIVANNAGVFTIYIRQDIDPTVSSSNVAGYLLKTPWDYTDDRWATYVFDPNTHKITFSVFNSNAAGTAPGTTERFKEDIVTNSLVKNGSLPATGDLNIAIDSYGLVIENLVLRYKVEEGGAPVNFDAQDNPEAIITEQFFFPLSQSTS